MGRCQAKEKAEAEAARQAALEARKAAEAAQASPADGAPSGLVAALAKAKAAGVLGADISLAESILSAQNPEEVEVNDLLQIPEEFRNLDPAAAAAAEKERNASLDREALEDRVVELTKHLAMARLHSKARLEQALQSRLAKAEMQSLQSLYVALQDAEAEFDKAAAEEFGELKVALRREHEDRAVESKGAAYAPDTDAMDGCSSASISLSPKLGDLAAAEEFGELKVALRREHEEAVAQVRALGSPTAGPPSDVQTPPLAAQARAPAPEVETFDPAQINQEFSKPVMFKNRPLTRCNVLHYAIIESASTKSGGPVSAVVAAKADITAKAMYASMKTHPDGKQVVYETELEAVHIAAGLGHIPALEALLKASADDAEGCKNRTREEHMVTVSELQEQNDELQERAASDNPDEAFEWILEVYRPGASHDTLRGELARDILIYKETEAAKDVAVRGRQVLYPFDQYFKTNEEVQMIAVEPEGKGRPNPQDLTKALVWAKQFER
ncbi:hypothetical protein AK812_SmicGene21431, partial [Symbiodinium microadriaticum]